MIRTVYNAVLVGAAIFLSYFVGVYVGGVKCNARMANINSEQIIANVKMVGETNDAVYSTSVGDIRRILREKYTIAK